MFQRTPATVIMRPNPTTDPEWWAREHQVYKSPFLSRFKQDLLLLTTILYKRSDYGLFSSLDLTAAVLLLLLGANLKGATMRYREVSGKECAFGAKRAFVAHDLCCPYVGGALCLVALCDGRFLVLTYVYRVEKGGRKLEPKTSMLLAVAL